MIVEPFVKRGLLASSRYRSTYVLRAAQALPPLLALGTVWIYWDVFAHDQYQKISRNDAAHGLMFALIGGPMLMLPYAFSRAATLIPLERDRKTLDALLSTRFSSFDIVSGVILQAMVGPLAVWFATLPIACFMFAFWGFEIQEWLLWSASFFSTMFILCALGVAGSADAVTVSKATGRVSLIAAMWGIAPLLMISLVLPRVNASLNRVLYPIIKWGLDSSPIGVLMNTIGPLGRVSILESTLRMIALEIGLGSLLIAFTTWRFRAACRSVYDTEGRLARALGFPAKVRKRWPSCGEDPIFWRERFSIKGQSRLERWTARLLNISLICVLVWGTYRFARPAFSEMQTLGYGFQPQMEVPNAMELFVEAFLRGSNGPPPLGLARPEFNLLLRVFTPLLHLMILLVTLGFSAESLTHEQKRDTWMGLIVTPLSAVDILKAKAFASVWRIRGYFIILGVLWTIGLASGAIHPLGYLAALIGLGISCWFAASLGTYVGLHSKDVVRGMMVLPYFLMLFSAVLVLIPVPWGNRIILGVGSMPFLTCLSLFSFEDVLVGFGRGGFPSFSTLDLSPDHGLKTALIVCVIGWTIQGVAAYCFQQAAVRDFDRVVGRPIRSSDFDPAAQVGENLAIGAL